QSSVRAYDVVTRDDRQIELSAVLINTPGHAVPADFLFREFPIEAQRAREVAAPAANLPMFVAAVQAVGTDEIRPDFVSRRIAVEPVPRRAVPEIVRAERSFVIGKRDEVCRLVSGETIRCFVIITVRPVALTLCARKIGY